MNNNEYNNFEEFNKTNEYKTYEAVQESINNRESYPSNGESLKTEEYGYNQKPNKICSKKMDQSIIKKLIQRVTESTISLTSGIAVTVIAAATVIISSLYMHSPTIELIDLIAGYDYVSYNLCIDEMDENIDYYAIISNNFETYKYELIEGENPNTIYNLRHDMKYNLYVLGVDVANNEEVRYFTFTFYTTVPSKNIRVQWIVEGEEVEYDTIEYGEEATYEGTTPIKPSTLENDYTFSGWTKTVDEITGDITYTAEFEPTTRMYNVKWIVEGEEVEYDTIEYGEEATYEGTTPIKPSTLENDYTFSGWTKTVDEITGDITHTAEFEPTTRMYNVKWIVEGEEVEYDTIEYGEEATYEGTTPIKPSTLENDYTFSGWTKTVDEITGDITYTAEFAIIQHEFTATYNQLSASDIIIDYENENYYVMRFNTEFDNSLDLRLSYRIILTDVNTNETYKYQGTEAFVEINVPTDVSSLTITYESIGTYNEVEKVFETINMPDALSISKILVEISDEFTLVATDSYRFAMLINSDMADEEVYNSVTLLVTYDDLSIEEVMIEDVVVNDTMFFTINVPDYCGSLTIDYTVNLLGANGHNRRNINGSKEFTFESIYELVRVSADIDEYQKVSFEFRYHFTDQETTLAVKDISTSTVTTLFEGSNVIDVSLNTRLTENEFTYYLSSTDGVAKETEISVIIPILSVTADYEFNSVNPGDAVVTFNDDDTMNIYLSTFFETKDPDVWYLVKYTDFNDSSYVYNVKYTESIAYIEDVPYSNYGVEYFVYKTVGDIDYLLRYTIPSGGIEIHDGNVCDGDVIENIDGTVNVSINFNYYYNIDLGSFVLLVDGSEYIISSTDIVYDETMYEYKLNYMLDDMPSELIVKYDRSFNYKTNYDIVSAGRQIKGNQYKTIYLILI